MLPFLELGVTPGVQLDFVPPWDDAVSEVIIPDKSFPLTGADHNTFYVSAITQNNVPIVESRYHPCTNNHLFLL